MIILIKSAPGVYWRCQEITQGNELPLCLSLKYIDITN